jgi:hypothetical protein
LSWWDKLFDYMHDPHRRICGPQPARYFVNCFL